MPTTTTVRPKYKTAGQMRHYVTIKQPSQVQEATYNATIPGAGSDPDGFCDFAKAWASIEPGMGEEGPYADQTFAKSPSTITIWYLAGVNSTMRVVFDNRIFQIANVSDPDERHIQLILSTVEYK